MVQVGNVRKLCCQFEAIFGALPILVVEIESLLGIERLAQSDVVITSHAMLAGTSTTLRKRGAKSAITILTSASAFSSHSSVFLNSE